MASYSKNISGLHHEDFNGASRTLIVGRHNIIKKNNFIFAYSVLKEPGIQVELDRRKQAAIPPVTFRHY